MEGWNEITIGVKEPGQAFSRTVQAVTCGVGGDFQSSLCQTQYIFF
jgi:hypothetical protein